MDISTILMIFLAALFSALLYVILKYFQRYKVYNLHGLTVNYITASGFSYMAYINGPYAGQANPNDFVQYALLIGILFITVFYTAALTAQKAGVAVTSIAGKMSMVIPILAGLWLYSEKLDLLKSSGIILALLAVYLSSVKVRNKNAVEKSKPDKTVWIFPVLLFIGSGLVDTCIKLSEHYFITETNKPLFLSFLFGSAGVAGIIATLYQRFGPARRKISGASIAGGILLGSVNYYSLEFLLKVLETPGLSSALAFAVVNVAVVLMSTFFAVVLFREPLSKPNIAGLILSVITIIILSI